MASRQTQAVSKPLLIIFLIVVVIGAVMLARNMSGGSAESEEIQNLPKPPEGWDPKPPPNEPGAAGGG
jgi:hypothetical protein